MPPQSAAARSTAGRPGVPPERPLEALLLVPPRSIRRERRLRERIDTDPLSRRFLDPPPSEGASDATTSTHNRERLGDRGPTKPSSDAAVAEAPTAGLCGEPFGVGGTLIGSFAAAESSPPSGAGPDDSNAADRFQPRNAEVDVHGQKRANEAHRGRTDPEAELHRESAGREAELAHTGHAVTENRHGPVATVAVTGANGTAERSAASEARGGLRAAHEVPPGTLGADKGHDGGESHRELDGRRIGPHVPSAKAPRGPEAVKGPKRKPGAAADESAGGRRRVSVEPEVPRGDRGGGGRSKSIGGSDRRRAVGRWELGQLWEIGAAACNPVRLIKPKPA